MKIAAQKAAAVPAAAPEEIRGAAVRKEAEAPGEAKGQAEAVPEAERSQARQQQRQPGQRQAKRLLQRPHPHLRPLRYPHQVRRLRRQERSPEGYGVRRRRRRKETANPGKQMGKTAPRRTFEIPLRMRTPKSI